MGISEEDLPGIGRRYELDVRDHARVVAVAHNNGPSDLFIFDREGSESRGSIHLDADTSRQMGAVLSGAYHRPSASEPLASIIDRFSLESVRVPDGSHVSERSIEELRVRQRTGASIVAVVTGKTALVDPQPSTLLRAGDEILVVGQPESIAAVRSMIEDDTAGAE